MNLQKIVMALKCNAYAEFCLLSGSGGGEKVSSQTYGEKTKETALHSSVVPFANLEQQV